MGHLSTCTNPKMHLIFQFSTNAGISYDKKNLTLDNTIINTISCSTMFRCLSKYLLMIYDSYFDVNMVIIGTYFLDINAQNY